MATQIHIMDSLSEHQLNLTLLNPISLTPSRKSLSANRCSTKWPLGQ